MWPLLLVPALLTPCSWSGGPFENATYNGGNKDPSTSSENADYLQDVRQSIFSSENGTVKGLRLLVLLADYISSQSSSQMSTS